MSTRFFYVDESYDANVFCLSALGIRDRDWKQCFDAVREFRRQIKQRFGILLHRELHAHELVSGRGRLGANIVTKRDRNIVYREFLQIATKLPSAMLFNICLEKRKHKDVQMAAWDRLMNRIERTMKRFEDAEAETRAKLVDQCRKHALDGEVLNAIEQRLSAYKSRAYVIADQGREEEITLCEKCAFLIRFRRNLASGHQERRPGTL